MLERFHEFVQEPKSSSVRLGLKLRLREAWSFEGRQHHGRAQEAYASQGTKVGEAIRKRMGQAASKREVAPTMSRTRSISRRTAH